MITEEARKVVEFYQAGKDSYSSAIKALRDAYSQPQLIYSHHVRQFLAPDSVSYTRRSLRQFREKFEVNIRGLERTDGATLPQFLAVVAIKSFDVRVRHEWTTHYTDNDRLPNIEEMLRFFRLHEFSLPEDPELEPAKTVKNFKSPSTNSKSRSHTVLKVSSSKSSDCPICQADHSFSKCSKFLNSDPEQRSQLVKDHKRCSNCLSAYHLCPQCTSAYNCRKCNNAITPCCIKSRQLQLLINLQKNQLSPL